MSDANLRRILARVRDGMMTVEDAAAALETWPYLDTGDAKLDLHRRARRGLPEVVLCGTKRPDQVAEIFHAIASAGQPALGTKADEDHWKSVREVLPEAEYEPIGRLLTWKPSGFAPRPVDTPPIAIVSAGTSDEPVVREAAGTLEAFGHPVRIVRDAGVAGLQRILSHVESIEEALVVIVVAGMDGALPSVVSGLISTPVIAVPTSVGYGANFDGLSALLAMLNNCSGGVTVVNIDNGFGAAYAAALIARKYAARETTPREGE